MRKSFLSYESISSLCFRLNTKVFSFVCLIVVVEPQPAVILKGNQKLADHISGYLWATSPFVFSVCLKPEKLICFVSIQPLLVV